MPPTPDRQSLKDHLVRTSPIILLTYAASSVVLGYGFGNPVIDVAGFASTAAAYLATDAGISRATRGRDLA